MKSRCAISAAAFLVSNSAFAQPQGWERSGEITILTTILTTPEGANLHAGASLENFPLLVRLH